jgi:predicted Zn-dependent protease
MNKILFQVTIFVSSFFTIWFVLSKVDWMSIIHVEEITKTSEKKLGDMLWFFYTKEEKEIKNENTRIPLDSILTKICTPNHIDKNQIKLHLIQSDEVNAFALPNKRLVLNSGLILACKNETELCGVMSHEIAHLELDHVMKRLIKEVGLSVLLSITTGINGSEKIKEIGKLLSSSAYDRNLEKAADLKAIDYMIKAKIDPVHYANFLSRLDNNEANNMKYFSWISTHPDSKARAKYIMDYTGNQTQNPIPIITQETWQKLRAYLTEK